MHKDFTGNVIITPATAGDPILVMLIYQIPAFGLTCSFKPICDIVPSSQISDADCNELDEIPFQDAVLGHRPTRAAAAAITYRDSDDKFGGGGDKMTTNLSRSPFQLER
ncbi:hypothetical protein N7520_005321 [Penicillium odoratum]|uniref:uncharacterized protein n=1 Tax=Penicillium odoratum TaxID=1167516 RepID=UPI002548FD7E|nr:uncharacterized protein N7520_005321 [Penicillium odoratum]KAJ5765762.1 hypothetical protein N7520_005321 [Penicillium odoratum]